MAQKHAPKPVPKKVSLISDNVPPPERGFKPKLPELKLKPGAHVPLRSPDTRGLKK